MSDPIFDVMAKFYYNLLKPYLKGRYSKIECAVETGTHLGNGTLNLAKNFKKIITIEINEALQNQAREMLKKNGINNISFILGDSGEVLKSISQSASEPAVFYLDAHWSGDKSVDWENSKWKGYGVDTGHTGSDTAPSSHEQVPLDREIAAIAKYFKPHGILYVDDLNKFDKKGRGLKNKIFMGEDWTHLDLKSLKKLMGTRIADWIDLDGIQLIITFKAIPNNWLLSFGNWLHYYSVLPVKIFLRRITGHHKKYRSVFHPTNYT